LTPAYDKQAPDTLSMVREQYKVLGSTLRDAGYTIADDKMATWFWFRRDFTPTQEIWHLPVEVGSETAKLKDWPQDPANTTQHNLGFV
ncbi:hypothetical protein ACO1MX_14730, partial [Staphylococcus aureus]